MRSSIAVALALAGLVLVSASPDARDHSATGFFLTSANPGRGGALVGLAGADRHCQMPGAAAGAGGRTWRAYLSTQEASGQPAVNACDRIGRGPWRNAAGAVIATDPGQLHGANNLTLAAALTETGARVNGRGMTPNEHDILTGSQSDGTAFRPGEDRTCGNWTSSTTGSAMVGHHDRMGLRDNEPSRSWNASQPSRACDMPALRATGGAGLFCGFAAD